MSDVYEVDELCGHRIIRGKQFYWVKWKGYDHDQNTWESAENISADLLEAYHTKISEADAGKSSKTTATTASRLADRASAKKQLTKRRSVSKEAAAASKKSPSSPGPKRTSPSHVSKPTTKASKRSRSPSPPVSKQISVAPSAPRSSLSPGALRPSSALAVLISKRSPVQEVSATNVPERKTQPKKSKPSALEDMQSATHDLRNEVAAMKDAARSRRQAFRNRRTSAARKESRDVEQLSEDSTVSTEDQKASRAGRPKKPSSARKRRKRSILSTPSRKKNRASEFFTVEKIIGSRTVKGQLQFLVKWEGYPKNQSTWETVESFGTNRHLIQEYFDSQ